jgi:hypothetical protein
MVNALDAMKAAPAKRGLHDDGADLSGVGLLRFRAIGAVYGIERLVWTARNSLRRGSRKPGPLDEEKVSEMMNLLAWQCANPPAESLASIMRRGL